MKSRNIVVIGGSGFIGSAVVRKLAALGKRVLVPTRRRERAKHLIVLPTVEVVEGNVNDDGALANLVAGADAVINLVGVLHGDTGSPYGARFKAAHVSLPGRIATACAGARVPRLLHMSALGVGPDAPSMYLRSKADGEAAVRDAAGTVAWTIFRPSVVFGRDDRFINLFADMQRFLPFMAAGGVQARLQPVHVEDVALAIVNALDDPATSGRVYELAGPKTYTLRELIEFAGRACGHPRPVIGLPDGLARMQAWMMEWSPFELLSRDNLDSLKVDSVSTAPFPAELGVRPVSLESVMTDHLAGRTPRARYMHLRDGAGR